MERASHILSAVAEEAVLMTSPQIRELYLKEFSLISLDPNRLLAVWCSSSGLVQNCFVEMSEPVSHEEVERIRNLINEELVGEPLESLEGELLKRIESQRDSLRRLYEHTLQIVRDSIPPRTSPRLWVEGSRYILNQPEFQDHEKLIGFIATLEEKSSLIELLLNAPFEKGVRVAIGEKELSKEIWDCSLVSAPYFWRQRPMGSIGVLGPRRMPYGKIISLVRQVAEEISGVLMRWDS